jgi:hypothetical protein
MFDEMDRLREAKELRELLEHYAALGAADRQAWQDRAMEKEGVGARELVKLHGELLAYGWLEQNTGVTPGPRQGPAPRCYRVRAAGARALKQARAEEAEAA